MLWVTFMLFTHKINTNFKEQIQLKRFFTFFQVKQMTLFDPRAIATIYFLINSSIFALYVLSIARRSWYRLKKINILLSLTLNYVLHVTLSIIHIMTTILHKKLCSGNCKTKKNDSLLDRGNAINISSWYHVFPIPTDCCPKINL